MEGLVDRRRIDWLDSLWRDDLQVTLHELERRNRRQALERQHRVICSLLARPEQTSEQISALFEAESSISDRIEATFYPSEAVDQLNYKKAWVRSSIDRWEQRFGKMTDPEVRKRIDATAAALQKLRHDTARQNSRRTTPPRKKQ